MQLAPSLGDDALRLQFADSSFIDFVVGIDYTGISAVTFVANAPDVIYARATELGLDLSSEDGSIAVGDLELRFLPG